MTTNAFLPHGIEECLVLAFDVLWVVGIVRGIAGYTIREFRNPASHETASVKRNCSDGNGLVPTG